MACGHRLKIIEFVALLLSCSPLNFVHFHFHFTFYRTFYSTYHIILYRITVSYVPVVSLESNLAAEKKYRKFITLPLNI